MIIYLIILIVIIVLIYMIKNKIILRIDTIFRKGFPKKDDKYGVYCFCGKQGDGKTYSMVDMLDFTGKNKIKICNIKSLCERSKNWVRGIEEFEKNKKLYKDKNNFYIYERNFNKIVEFLEKEDETQKYIVVYDEIFTLIEKGKISKDSISFLSQMRKRGLYLYTTCQEWLELNVTFRRYVRYQIECRMINLKLFNCAISINKVNNAYEMKWDNLQNEYVCPIIQTNIKKCGLKIANSYDTYETIETEGKMLAR